ncbi:ATP-dependent 6-phosphofructokinase [Methanocella sp. MCL-LM]|uniref:ATP-dependent 6-phosphofructokinase n=1 Tax=Methanocella sp. MCL-LM TaxID=3412035 RepID=UPI003C742795
MKTIGVVTSGGDAPGMNAAIRAVVRIAQVHGIAVIGFERGWEGLIYNNTVQLTPRSVSGIVQQGGTILRTSRNREFTTDEGMRKAQVTLANNNVDGLIVIGGDGSFRAAHEFSKYTDTRIAGIPATIDNDVFGTDETIGFDTAVNTGVSEIDKIRDTATSLDRVFIVEVMGRTRGFLAAMIGLTVGAEIILVPEVKFHPEDVCDAIIKNSAAGKKSGIIVAAEGIGDTHALAKEIQEHTMIETRLSVLGYAQRGGHPTARSRFLASIFGKAAVEFLADGKENLIAAWQQGKITGVRFDETCCKAKELDLRLLKLAEELAK